MTTPINETTDFLKVECAKSEDSSDQTARAVFSPVLASAVTAGQWGKKYSGGPVPLMSTIKALEEAAKRVNANDLSEVEARLNGQAVALDTIFAELSRRAAVNISEYPDAFDRFIRLALKAQNQCRMTLESLANIKNPPTVFARQANFNNGGHQQVNNGTAPHAPARENKNPPSKLVEQSNETPMDIETAGIARSANSAVEAVDPFNRAEVR